MAVREQVGAQTAVRGGRTAPWGTKRPWQGIESAERSRMDGAQNGRQGAHRAWRGVESARTAGRGARRRRKTAPRGPKTAWQGVERTAQEGDDGDKCSATDARGHGTATRGRSEHVGAHNGDAGAWQGGGGVACGQARAAGKGEGGRGAQDASTRLSVRNRRAGVVLWRARPVGSASCAVTAAGVLDWAMWGPTRAAEACKTQVRACVCETAVHKLEVAVLGRGESDKVSVQQRWWGERRQGDGTQRPSEGGKGGAKRLHRAVTGPREGVSRTERARGTGRAKWGCAGLKRRRAGGAGPREGGGSARNDGVGASVQNRGAHACSSGAGASSGSAGAARGHVMVVRVRERTGRGAGTEAQNGGVPAQNGCTHVWNARHGEGGDAAQHGVGAGHGIGGRTRRKGRRGGARGGRVCARDGARWGEAGRHTRRWVQGRESERVGDVRLLDGATESARGGSGAREREERDEKNVPMMVPLGTSAP
ncbi:hypothetical protein DENSPDRAFT_853994 [Dentipellis sp. KUC8613]|nr:hypothetical protein DENSPDRAFT_853994 [Dentipellis sp. KUC8613]